jgi:hypothetical protein
MAKPIRPMPDSNQTDATFSIFELTERKISKISLQAAESFTPADNFREQVVCRCWGESFKEAVLVQGSLGEGDLT